MVVGRRHFISWNSFAHKYLKSLLKFDPWLNLKPIHISTNQSSNH